MSLYQRSTIFNKPSKYKDGKLYSILPANGAADFTVSRLSEKRYLGQDGLIKTAANNVPALEYNRSGKYVGLDIERESTNIQGNSLMQSGWTGSAGTTLTTNTNETLDPAGTNQALKIERATLGLNFAQNGSQSVSAGQISIKSIYYKKGTVANDVVAFELADGGSGSINIDIVAKLFSRTGSIQSTDSDGFGIESVGNGWYFVWVRRRFINASSWSSIYTQSFGNSTGSWYLWGVQVENNCYYPTSLIATTTSTSRPADNVKCTTLSSIINNANREGTIELVARRNLQQFQAELFNLTQAGASDTNRVFLRTTGADRIQAVVRTTESRTNLALRSQEFDVSASWNPFNVSMLSNVVVAPDGTLTADKLGENTANSTHLIDQLVTVTNATPYTFSVFARAAERGFLRIRIGDAIGGGTLIESVVFNLNQGSIHTAPLVAGAASIDMIGNGWYRCSIRATSISTSLAFMLQLSTDGTTSSYTGVSNNGVFLWGAQLETGSVATAYIPTTSAAVTVNYNETVIAQTPASNTNLVFRSEEFDNASWQSQNVTITPNAGVAPNGSSTADKMVTANGQNLSSVVSRTLQSITKPAIANTYTASIYAKAVEHNRITLILSDAPYTNSASVTYNLNDGSIAVAASSSGTYSNVSSGIESIGNGWYRVFLTATTDTATSLILTIDERDSVAVNGDGVSGILIWGAQLELGGTASRYVRTESVAVTDSPAVGTCRLQFRYKDNDCVLMLNGQPQNTYTFVAASLPTPPVEGSSYTHNGVRWRVVSVSGLNIKMRMISGNTEPSAPGTLTKAGGTGSDSITINSVSMDKPAVTIPSNLTECYIGGRTPSDNANFILDNLLYCPLGLSDTDMKSLDAQLATVIT